MKSILLAMVVLLSVVAFVLGKAVVRLENYRYADTVGFCSELQSRDNALMRIERGKCLERTQTRTHWFWHLLYGTGLL
jgi:hypothetical protein